MDLQMCNVFSSFRSFVRQQQCVHVFPYAVLVLISGCGGTGTPPVAAPTNTNAAESPIAESAIRESPTESQVVPSSSAVSASSSTSRTTHRRDEVWVDDKGQKWFGNVPMDAFFDEPYTVASDATPIGGAPSTLVAANTGEPGSTPDPAANGDVPAVADPEMTKDPEKPEPGTAAPADGDSWGALVSKAVLEEEVKSIRNFMNENLQSVGTFNSSMLMIPPKAAALGALAGVVMEYPESISWKDDAKYIRNLAKKMNESTLQRGAKDQKRLLELFEGLRDTLDRSKPAGLEEPPETDSFADVSEMRLLMMRMEEAEKRMKTEAGTEGAMGSKKEMIAHEASMMAIMARIVTLPGYGYEDDAQFKEWGNDVVAAAGNIRAAAESSDFASYESALTKVATTCQNCHSKYKND